MKLNDRIKEFNAEIARLKKLIPGLQCSDEMLTDRCQILMLIGYVDENATIFSIDSKTEEPQILAQRLLDGHIVLISRLHDNVVALEKLIEEDSGTGTDNNSG